MRLAEATSGGAQIPRGRLTILCPRETPELAGQWWGPHTTTWKPAGSTSRCLSTPASQALPRAARDKDVRHGKQTASRPAHREGAVSSRPVGDKVIGKPEAGHV